MFGIVKGSFHKIWEYNNCETLERVRVMGNRNVRLVVGTKLQSDTIMKEVVVCSVEWIETRTINRLYISSNYKKIYWKILSQRTDKCFSLATYLLVDLVKMV